MPATEQSGLIDDAAADWELGDSGYLEPVTVGEGDSFPDDEQTPSEPVESSDQDDAEVEVSQSEAPDEDQDTPDNYEKRYNDLRPEFDRKSQELSELQNKYGELEQKFGQAVQYLQHFNEQARKQSQGQESQDEGDLIEIFADPEKGHKYLRQKIQDAVEQRLSQYKPVLKHAETNAEMQAALNKYPDLLEYSDEMQSIMKALPQRKLSIEEAYVLAKRSAPNKQEAQESAPSKPQDNGTPDSEPSTKVSADELTERATRLQTETGVGGLSEDAAPKREANSVQEALDMALDEVFGH